MTDRIDRLYEFIADEEDARVCEDISDSACREVPGNFFRILLTQFPLQSWGSRLTKLFEVQSVKMAMAQSVTASKGEQIFMMDSSLR